MNTTVKLTKRRTNALAQLKKQLADGTKPNKPEGISPEGKTITKQKKDTPRIPLNEKDKARITKEIKVLSERISGGGIY